MRKLSLFYKLIFYCLIYQSYLFFLKGSIELLTKEYHQNIFFNTKIYDGLNKNDFKKGELIQILYKLKAIKRVEWEDDRFRSYFIGSIEDDVNA